MKRFLLLSLLFSTQLSFAQKQYEKWCFGHQCGIDFSTGIAVAITTPMTTLYGVSESGAMICDLNGNLLFYSDGDGTDSTCNGVRWGKIWNRNGVTMDGGILDDTAGGGYSSRQGALIVPRPGTTDQYYLLNSDHVEWEGDTMCTQPYPYKKGGGVGYFLIDMSQNGGDGKVMEYNKKLLVPSFEGLTATRHANGMDYWIATQTGWYDLGFPSADSVFIYRLTSTGFSAPLKFPLGINDAMLRFSPDGKKFFVEDTKTVYDFDNATGNISNPRVLTNTGSTFNLSWVFSPNSKYLYYLEYVMVGIFNYKYSLFQYDTDAANISATKTLVANTPTLPVTGGIILYGQAQTAPDGKIYIARYNGEDSLDCQTLSVIHCPNKYGSAANFVENGFTLMPNTYVSFNMPNNIEYFLQSEDTCGLTIRADYTYLKNCYLDSIPFVDMSYTNITSWSWNFGDPGSGANNFSTLQNPVHKFATPGVYTVTLIVSDGTYSDTIFYNTEILNCFPKGVDEHHLTFETTVFPNPSSDGCTFTFSDGGTIYSLEIFDVSGRLILNEKNITGNSFSLNTSGISSGTYFFRVISDVDKISRGKLVVGK